jgi:hypothetical protein
MEPLEKLGAAGGILALCGFFWGIPLLFTDKPTIMPLVFGVVGLVLLILSWILDR